MKAEKPGKGADRKQMKYICNTTDFYSDVPSAITLGKFEGLHRGHQKLIREIVRLQRKEHMQGIVFTIAPETKPSLLTVREKRNILERMGVDCMIKCPFVPEILGMEAEEFISSVLTDRLKAKYIVVGTDFRFGRGRSGDVRLLESLQKKYGYTLFVIEKECYEGREISSTYVKEALARADMDTVQTLLGFPYPVCGTVLHGKQLGRRIGMPTINQIPGHLKLLPPEGVYYSDVICGKLNCHGMTNIGYKPTVDGSFLGVETYLYGVDEELYGCEAEVCIRKFRRPEQKFPSVEALKLQMEFDIQAGKEFFRVN